MSRNAWLLEFNRILVVFVPCVVAGIITGSLSLFVILAFVVYGVWTARQLVTLKRWLSGGAAIDQAPEYWGLIDQHVSSIVELQKSNLDKQNSLTEFVNRFDRMIAALPDAVVTMTASGEILSCNQAAHDLLRIHPQHDQHTRITQLIRDPLFTDYFSAGKFDHPLEVRGVTINEPELSMRIIPFGEDNLVLIAQDISQSARINEMRRSFISNASHELRTPLTVILGYLEVLSEHAELPGKYAAALRTAELQAQRMKQLVEELLTLSRLESSVTVAARDDVISIASLTKEVVREVRVSPWFTDHDIHCSIETEATLKGNVQEIHSLVSNLVSNAVKHTEAGTGVRIVWRWLEDEKCAQLMVEDDGQGIASEHLGRLTERFYRVDVGRSREKGGTGLGLSIVKHVVDHHEGTLAITSQLGKGTSFICSFPATRLVYGGENSK